MSNLLELKILIIDDNPGDLLLIEDYLAENLGMAIVSRALSFSSAEKMLQGRVAFDVILLDLSLPDKTGKELIEEIIRLAGNALVIVLTGYENIEFSILSLQLGVADYLIKDDINGSVLFKSIVYNFERRKTNRLLLESEKKYSDLFHLSPQPMWIYDLENLQFLDVNQQAIRHYGFSRDEFLSMTIREIRPPEDIPILEKAVNVVRSTGMAIQGTTFRHKKKNGNIIFVNLKSDQIIFNGRKAEIVVSNDITEINKYIKTIQHQNEKLREIAWTQSHVVRAPLARMMSLIELTKNPATDYLEKIEYLGLIMECSKDLDTVIRDISKKTYEASNL
jgi:PAS domain S-box-containing protein